MRDITVNGLLVDKRDNVAVVLEEMKPGDVLYYKIPGAPDIQAISVLNVIPIYHKVAVKNILEDEEILKYGEVIGTAYDNIHAGEHVHLQNVKDKRNQLIINGRKV